MNKLNKWSLAAIGGVILAGALGAGAVMAQTPVPGTATTGTTFLSRVAQKLGIDTPTLQNAIKTTQTQDVDAQVAAGKLTQAQADQIKQRIANAPEDAPIFGGGFGDHGPRHGGPIDPQKIATFLGVPADQFRTEMDATGATLATVAQAHGKSRDDLKAFLTADLKTHVAAEVTNGKLTQAQADARIADRTADLDQIIDSTGPHRGGPHRGDRDQGGFSGNQTPSTTPAANDGTING